MHEYKIPEEKFLIIPNYLPRWWIGEAYDLNRQMHQWQEQRNRPTIAFVCSINHFDLQNRNGGVDDFTHLIPWIIQNMNRYKFVFVGGVPLQLHQYVKEGKITFQPPSDLFNYPREMQKRKIDLLVAPLANNNFNKCKSNIKFLEFSALGIPMAGQNICTYNKYTKLVFNDGNGVWADMCSIKWNPLNSNENKVMGSTTVSFYKGAPVFHISGMNGSMSLGAIWFDKSQGIEVLKHERGHNTQLMAMGLGNYLIQIGIPSLWKNDDNSPWELSASMLGDSALANEGKEYQKEQARNYFKRSLIPFVNFYNVYEYILYQ